MVSPTTTRDPDEGGDVPMHAEFADLVSAELPMQLDALCALKTQVIGHVERKRQVVEAGAVPRLLAVCDDPLSDEAARLEATIVLAALCNGEADLLHESGAVRELAMIDVFGRLVSRSEAGSPLRLPAMRALVPIVRSREDARQLWRYAAEGHWCYALLRDARGSTRPTNLQHVTSLAQLAATYSDDIAVPTQFLEHLFSELAVIVINTTQMGRCRNGLTAMHTRLVECCLAAVAAGNRASEALACGICDAVYDCYPDTPDGDENPLIKTLLLLVRSDARQLRLEAAWLLASMTRHDLGPDITRKEMALVVLPIVIRLFDEADLSSRAPFILSDLIADSDEMQKAACEAGAIKRLAAILSSDATSSVARDDGARQSALLALAAIALYKDDYRKQIIEAKCVPLIVTAMASPSASVRSAACQCARSLSRSVTMLKTSLVDTGMGAAVLGLLDDTDVEVQTEACAVLCNLVLEFSPVRKQILDGGVLRRLAALVNSTSLDLQVNALWAFKHIVFAADAGIKEQALVELGPGRLAAWCKDTNPALAEQAGEIVRNLGCGRPENVDVLVKAVGATTLVDVLVHNLASGTEQLVIPAVYALVNIAAGSEQQQAEIIMRRPKILQWLHTHLSNRWAEVRLGAVWTLINLTWLDDDSRGQERRARVAALQSLGFQQKLQEMADDSSLDVRERVRTALAQMEAAAV